VRSATVRRMQRKRQAVLGAVCHAVGTTEGQHDGERQGRRGGIASLKWSSENCPSVWRKAARPLCLGTSPRLGGAVLQEAVAGEVLARV